VGEDHTEAAAESGYVTTEVAAAGLSVSPRTVRDYIKAGKLEAKSQGEGVERRWLVSIDSLHALRQSRQASAELPRNRRGEASSGENAAELAAELLATVQDLQYRLGRAEARAELTERAESSVREERDRLLADLERERRRAEEERQKGEQLQVELETLRASQTAAEASGAQEPRPATGGTPEPLEPFEGQGSGTGRGSLWRRLFGR
jgi:hypothetical protein